MDNIVFKRTKYLVVEGEILTLQHSSFTDTWYDDYGCLWAIEDDAKGADPVVRCGVGFASLPASHPLTDACRRHDYAYSSPTYQLFHTRKEADDFLYLQIKMVGKGHWYRILATPFYRLVRTFGWKFWENEKTE